MKKVLLTGGILLVAFIILIAVIGGKDKTSKGKLKGFSLSPKSFTESDFLAFFEKAKANGKVLSTAGKTEELVDPKSAAYVVTTIAPQYGLTPVVVISKADTEAIVDFVTKQKPPYLGVGNEINRLPKAELDALITTFPTMYEAVKKASPKTKIFTVFQYESLKGLNGGLFGGANNANNNDWEMLNKFPMADFFAFTTYPGLIYKAPSEIPKDYYQEITKYTDKPVAFTEIGWPSGTEVAGWESDEEEQASFVTKFFAITKDLPTEFVIWSFLYDQNLQKPFTSIGLIDKNDHEKKALRTWVELP